jgi:hypothetical protein
MKFYPINRILVTMAPGGFGQNVRRQTAAEIYAIKRAFERTVPEELRLEFPDYLNYDVKRCVSNAYFRGAKRGKDIGLFIDGMKEIIGV